MICMLGLSTIAAVSGEELVEDPWLQLVAQLEHHDPAVLSARAQVEAARLLVDQARVTHNPSLEVELEELAPWDSDSEGPRARVGYSIEREASAKISSRVAVAELAVRQAEADFAITRADAAAVMLEQLIEIRRAEGLAASRQVILASLERTINVIRLRVEEGEAPGAELHRLAAERALEHAQLDVLELEAWAIRESLKSRLHADDDLIDRLIRASTLPYPIAGLTEADWIAAALEHSPVREIRRLELVALELELAGAGVASRSDLTYRAFVERSRHDTALGVGIEVPLKQGGNGTAALQDALESRRTALATSLALEEALLAEEIRRRLRIVESSARPLALLEGEALTAAEQALEAARLAYTEGEGELLDYLDAVRQHQEVAEAVIEARIAHEAAVVALITATGLATNPEVLQ